jgi:hypothetical protein
MNLLLLRLAGPIIAIDSNLRLTRRVAPKEGGDVGALTNWFADAKRTCSNSPMSILKEFRDFALTGSVIDLAVGVIVGAAFGKIVSSLVSNVIMPPIGLLLGRVDFSNLFINLSGQPVDSYQDATQRGVLCWLTGRLATPSSSF